LPSIYLNQVVMGIDVRSSLYDTAPSRILQEGKLDFSDSTPQGAASMASLLRIWS